MRFKDKPPSQRNCKLLCHNNWAIIHDPTTIKHGRETDTTKWIRPLSWIDLIDVHQNLVFEVTKNRWNRSSSRGGRRKAECTTIAPERNRQGNEKSMQIPTKGSRETSRQTKRSTSIAWQRRQKKPLAVETWSSCIISPGWAVNMEDRKDQLRTKMGRPSLEKKGNSMGGRSTSRNFWTDLAYSTYPQDI